MGLHFVIAAAAPLAAGSMAYGWLQPPRSKAGVALSAYVVVVALGTSAYLIWDAFQ